jgi:hypothetical protein
MDRTAILATGMAVIFFRRRSLAGISDVRGGRFPQESGDVGPITVWKFALPFSGDVADGLPTPVSS